MFGLPSRQETMNIAEDVYNYVVKWINMETQIYHEFGAPSANAPQDRNVFYRWSQLNLGAIENEANYREFVHWLTRGGLDYKQYAVARIPQMLSELCIQHGTKRMKAYIDRCVEAVAYSYDLPIKLVRQLQEDTKALWVFVILKQAHIYGHVTF